MAAAGKNEELSARLGEHASEMNERGGEGADRGRTVGSRMGVVYVLLSAVFFSLAGLLIKITPWSALSINAGRCLFAFGVIYLFMRSQGRRFKLNGAVVLGGFMNFAMTQTFAFANKLTTAANAIVLQFTEPVFAILIMWLVFKVRPSRAAVLTCAVVMMGILCFFFDELSATGALGNVLAVISGLAYAGVFFIKKMPDGDFESSTLLSFAACIVVGLPALVADASAGLVAGAELGWALSPWLIIAFMGVVQTGASYICLSKGLDTVPPVAASLISTIEPILNPILVAVAIGETIGPLSLLGAVMVIGASTAYNMLSPDATGAGGRGADVTNERGDRISPGYL